MKFSIFLCLIICSQLLGIILTSKLSMSSRRSLGKHSKTKLAITDTYFYHLASGVILEVGGKVDFLEKCIDNWKKDGMNETDDLKNLKFKLDGKFKRTFQRLSGYLNNSLEFVCVFRDKLESFYGKKNLGFSKQRRRMFYSKKNRNKRRYETYHWVLLDFITVVKDRFENVAHGVSKGTFNIANPIVNGTDWSKKPKPQIQEFIEKSLRETMEPALNFIESIKDKFLEILRNDPVIKRVIRMLKCLLKDKSLVEEYDDMLGTIRDFITNHTEFDSSHGWAKLLFSLLCDWNKLREAVMSLVNAFENNDGHQKYKNFGRFFGRIIKASENN